MSQRSPPGFWYDQFWAEWVIVLAGSAGLCFEGEAEARVLYVLIPACLKTPPNGRAKIMRRSGSPAIIPKRNRTGQLKLPRFKGFPITRNAAIEEAANS
jgi:hypothetical protein